MISFSRQSFIPRRLTELGAFVSRRRTNDNNINNPFPFVVVRSSSHFGNRSKGRMSRFEELNELAIKAGGAPKGIRSILGEDHPRPGDAAFFQQVGCSRRIFLLQPYMTADELEGLAHRITALSKNQGISSVLIANDGTDESLGIPSSLRSDMRPFRDLSLPLPGLIPERSANAPHVASGYDPLKLYQSGLHKNEEYLENKLLISLSKLAIATKGDKNKTKIPIITFPHGSITDGGYALLMGSYAIATYETSYRIRNPSRGLSLDPVGLSYILPRLGREFNQTSKKYSGCGMLLGLTGFHAGPIDMIETGLATHYMQGVNGLGLMETALSEIAPWNQQDVLKFPVHYFGDPPPKVDHNADYRNVAVADTIDVFTDFAAEPAANLLDLSTAQVTGIGDPSVAPNSTPWEVETESPLVDIAATFDSIFNSESTLVGILERFREISMREAEDSDEEEVIQVATSIVNALENQSPLAVSVVHHLLRLGQDGFETLDNCMRRERRVQTKMLGRKDFEAWARHVEVNGDVEFRGWEHKSIADVTTDEVLEIIGE